MSGDVLEARGLGKRFGGLAACSGVSLSVREGEVHAVIGPNGAGKSTLINLLSGDLRPTDGTILLDGRDVTVSGPDRRCRGGIGRSYQKTTIFPERTVFDNARLAAQATRPGALAMRCDGKRRSDVREAALAALAEVGLEGRADTPARSMSHGEQRQLEVAMVLATAPRLVLLDEPLAGMGHAEARRMTGLIASLKAGRGILLVEHDMDAVFAIADRLTVMADGKVIASGTVDAVRRDPVVRAAYLGEAEDVA
ncbi:ABC transporter ATP-binding protein [Aminobacter aganoensis]|uniref:Branched-chain amino acid transport system ATP-binding protein n=1 Tax=Aminobacter aganoensis TaxID=83264 RepID=A0A7X0F9B4_9HYPH|nr:ABC transporter ATP-binding protein [Aminobacter aganoensis]MBB6355328.1 branched-chain amino acid transport system ATP-binding protein [Aminobacter aganoensis]